MTELITCPHCGLDHGVHQTTCDVTGLDLPSRSHLQGADRAESSFDTGKNVATGADGAVPGGGGDPFAGRTNSAPVRTVVIAGLSFPLSTESPIVVGRETGVGASLKLPDNVSTTHAVIRAAADGVVTITDIGSQGRGSTNGTFVNGVKILANEPTIVAPGDRVELGQAPATVIGLVE